MLVPVALGAVLEVGVAELTPQSLGSTVSTWVNAHRLANRWHTQGHPGTGGERCVCREARTQLCSGGQRQRHWMETDGQMREMGEARAGTDSVNTGTGTSLGHRHFVDRSAPSRGRVPPHMRGRRVSGQTHELLTWT